jgi:outer membrane receptor protein involved in Fe transport
VLADAAAVSVVDIVRGAAGTNALQQAQAGVVRVLLVVGDGLLAQQAAVGVVAVDDTAIDAALEGNSLLDDKPYEAEL